MDMKNGHYFLLGRILFCTQSLCVANVVWIEVFGHDNSVQIY